MRAKSKIKETKNDNKSERNGTTNVNSSIPDSGTLCSAIVFSCAQSQFYGHQPSSTKVPGQIGKRTGFGRGKKKGREKTH
jgi:hypothetical protein